MPISYEIDRAAELAIVRVTGDVTTQEFQKYFKASREHPDFDATFDRLVIATGITSFPAANEVSALAPEIRRRTSERTVRFAVVADSPLAIGMVNMYLGQSGLSDRYETFSDAASAREWLRR
jgi:hypothetical protein